MPPPIRVTERERESVRERGREREAPWREGGRKRESRERTSREWRKGRELRLR